LLLQQLLQLSASAPTRVSGTDCCCVCELQVFDVELRQIRKCERRQMMMFSDVVCE
jgi:hypothetical protein